MAELSNLERRQLERLLRMGGGYVLNFSNRTLEEFVLDSVGRNIYDAKYDLGSGSKANRLRCFWKDEADPTVAKLLGDLLDYAESECGIKRDDKDMQAGRRAVMRLRESRLVPEIRALSAASDERDFDVVARAVRDAIERNEPEGGLDRLHTFVVKYVRALCRESGIEAGRERALQSIFGEYVKWLRESGAIESDMTLRILKSTISTLEAFNDVRNNQSLAHDNPVLNYEEALLIFNHVAASIRFLRSIARRGEGPATVGDAADEPAY